MPQPRNQTSERRRTSSRGGSTPSTTRAHRDELRQISDNDDTAIAGLVAIRVEEAARQLGHRPCLRPAGGSARATAATPR